MYLYTSTDGYVFSIFLTESYLEDGALLSIGVPILSVSIIYFNPCLTLIKVSSTGISKILLCYFFGGSSFVDDTMVAFGPLLEWDLDEIAEGDGRSTLC